MVGAEQPGKAESIRRLGQTLPARPVQPRLPLDHDSDIQASAPFLNAIAGRKKLLRSYPRSAGQDKQPRSIPERCLCIGKGEHWLARLLTTEWAYISRC